MSASVSQKTIRRLTAAEGYLALDLPGYALDELTAIGEAGPLEPLVHLMTGEALKGQKRYDDAIEPLKQAAQMIPAPHNQVAWQSLSECFRHEGHDELADVVKMFADTPAAPQLTIELPPGVNIEPGTTLNVVFRKPM
jgi:hypothetical protein